ncbi:hypothetical protein HDV63DRAFT_73411 [Trichoderma sp. SZMC 28014]
MYIPTWPECTSVCPKSALLLRPRSHWAFFTLQACAFSTRQPQFCARTDDREKRTPKQDPQTEPPAAPATGPAPKGRDTAWTPCCWRTKGAAKLLSIHVPARRLGAGSGTRTCSRSCKG